MRVLVTGGAGYIGSHMCKMLAEAGHRVVVCDDLSTGHAEAVRWGRLIRCRIGGPSLEAELKRQPFDAVIHFAAKSIVAQSVIEPLAPYRTNVVETIELLEMMRRHAVRKLVFSSSAAVYGNSDAGHIDEGQPCRPINPYGRSKRMVEEVLADMACAGHIDAVALRYFNVAGADESGQLGEDHEPETHLIPCILRQAGTGAEPVLINGADYPTDDGSCVRDYIHVTDVCAAHLRALMFLSGGCGFHAFNIGSGSGHSVRQIVAAAREVLGHPFPVRVAAPRPGDPATLVADSRRAAQVLGWKPRYTDIRQIVETAARWHRRRGAW